MPPDYHVDGQELIDSSKISTITVSSRSSFEVAQQVTAQGKGLK